MALWNVDSHCSTAEGEMKGYVLQCASSRCCSATMQLRLYSMLLPVSSAISMHKQSSSARVLQERAQYTNFIEVLKRASKRLRYKCTFALFAQLTSPALCVRTAVLMQSVALTNQMENVMLESPGEPLVVKLIDFGLSQVFAKGEKMRTACGTV
jgi:hypothetical protein